MHAWGWVGRATVHAWGWAGLCGAACVELGGYLGDIAVTDKTRRVHVHLGEGEREGEGESAGEGAGAGEREGERGDGTSSDVPPSPHVPESL